MSDQLSPPRVVRSYDAEFKIKVLNRVKELGNVKAASLEFNVPLGTIHAWNHKVKSKGVEALSNKSRRPHHQPKKTSQWH